MSPQTPAEFDYIVVGSGAGGGPVAANLAGAGFTVLLIEAGDHHESLNYSIPALHGQATQDPAMRWDFWVRHYEDQEQQEQDSKYRATHAGQTVDGVLYPRAATLGGCTAHNAMITIYPHDSDWRHLVEATGDSNFSPDKMRGYFQRLERCQYRTPPHSPADDPARHGHAGWLGTSIASPDLILGDNQLTKVITSAAAETLSDLLGGPSGSFLQALLKVTASAEQARKMVSLQAGDEREALKEALLLQYDPNDYRVTLDQREGIFAIPQSTSGGARNGARERVLQAQAQSPDRLQLKTNALVTRILFEGDTAVGVEYREGARLYQAAPAPEGGRSPGDPVQVRARREVIICGGSFNTPQLLMLSGIGPADELERHAIHVIVNLPAVGRNLQDRYEVAVISQLNQDLSVHANCRFRLPKGDEQPDPGLDQWHETPRRGPYTSNGTMIGIARKSKADLIEPDLFITAIPTFFKGYFPFYADHLVEDPDNAAARRNVLSWAVLKGHTQNTDGEVTLRSKDPCQPPRINFHYFREKSHTAGPDPDLQAVVEGVKLVRNIMQKPSVAQLVTRTELQPGGNIDDDQEIETWVRKEAWGHHACGTCRMGRGDDRQAVVDGQFRVRGVKNLRVVDASVFPKIPGFFIVTSIYMLAEKASEDILRDAGADLPPVA